MSGSVFLLVGGYIEPWNKCLLEIVFGVLVDANLCVCLCVCVVGVQVCLISLT